MLISNPPGYELGFQIGSGGMATVCYGRRVSAGGFAHAVAIKQLHPHLASNPEIVSMFLDEARLAARVVHANVVSILDVVQRDQQVWAVMQYIEGESLARLVKQTLASGRPVPLGVAVAVTVDLLAGLEAAHTATDDRGEALGIVHRDVSPQNVLVGADGVARVLDFGVAKARGRLHETRDGQVKGKLAYMAPEQLGGEANVSTDLYAAGIVLWELLAGRRLFRGNTEMDVMGQVLLGAVSPPSQHATVSPALDEVVMRALSTVPKQRFESAAVFAGALVNACPGVTATRSEVAAWVRDVAGPEIAERQRLAVEMARGPVGMTSLQGVTQSQPFVATVVMPPVRTPGKQRARWGLWLAIVALVVAGLVGMRVKRRSSEPNAMAASTEQLPLTTATAATGPSSAPASAPATEPKTLPVASSSRSPPNVRSLARTPKAASPKAPPAATTATATAAPTVAADCDPAFVVDASGMRHYKRHCIQ